MITKDKVKNIVEEGISETSLFLVDIKITPKHKIAVFLDGYQGVSIDDCAFVSRHIESKLNREEEDFELQVSSAGIGNPFKVKEQYQKTLGKQIDIVLKDGEKITGKLLTVEEKNIEIETRDNVKQKEKKKEEMQTNVKTVAFEDILKAKEIITF